ncbi:Ferredoxin--NADP reductase [Dissostichus eleginoides]|uniref:Ferredoxin--NADP reductase n=1 Tax=Dissostichus eleginoides TaxID=100907 RepID=A0AAD9B177_DISEL|nr:Ferredoxin--NADP reductase [Dissostichus eleginoides]
MDLKALETKWRTVLSSILDELTGDEFRKLLFNLEKIPQGKKGGRPRGDMPSVIIQYYGTEGSIALIDRQMRNLPRLDAAVQQPLRGMKDELKKLQEKSKEVSGSSGETQIMIDSTQKLALSPQAPQRFPEAAVKPRG